MYKGVTKSQRKSGKFPTSHIDLSPTGAVASYV